MPGDVRRARSARGSSERRRARLTRNARVSCAPAALPRRTAMTPKTSDHILIVDDDREIRELLTAYLRPSDIDAAKHGRAVLKLLVRKLRAAWPEVKITIRGDSGFCRWRLMRWCDSHGIGYVLGLAKNKVLERATREEVEQAARPKGRGLGVIEAVVHGDQRERAGAQGQLHVAHMERGDPLVGRPGRQILQHAMVADIVPSSGIDT